MAKMTAAEAAVYVMEKEGVTQLFGVPGAGINPFYAALKKRGSMKHILARHGEAIGHMAEGYTRAAAGNIGVGIPRVDHQRQARLAGGGDMRPEALLLNVARAVIVMIVEPGLADRHHLGMTGQRHQFLDRDVWLLGGIMRMRADRAEHSVMRLDERDQLVEAPHPRRDRHHQADAGRPGAGENRLDVARKLGKIEMAMTVDQHGATKDRYSTNLLA